MEKRVRRLWKRSWRGEKSAGEEMGGKKKESRVEGEERWGRTGDELEAGGTTEEIGRERGEGGQEGSQDLS